MKHTTHNTTLHPTKPATRVLSDELGVRPNMGKIRWFLIGAVLLANIAAVLFALLPTLVTFAEVLPDGVYCAACESPEVKAALIRAASAGRLQVIGISSSYNWLFIFVASFNVAALVAALFNPDLTSRSKGRSASLRAP